MRRFFSQRGAKLRQICLNAKYFAKNKLFSEIFLRLMRLKCRKRRVFSIATWQQCFKTRWLGR